MKAAVLYVDKQGTVTVSLPLRLVKPAPPIMVLLVQLDTLLRQVRA